RVVGVVGVHSDLDPRLEPDPDHLGRARRIIGIAHDKAACVDTGPGSAGRQFVPRQIPVRSHRGTRGSPSRLVAISSRWMSLLPPPNVPTSAASYACASSSASRRSPPPTTCCSDRVTSMIVSVPY